MRKALLIALLAMLVLSGCSAKGKDKAPAAVTCPDGTVLTPDQIKALEGYGTPGFNATKACPVKPSVKFTTMPSSIQVFKSAPFGWTLDAGTATPAHSMLTSIRWNDRSIPDQDLTNINKYPYELVKKEHQNLPITYQGNMTFVKAEKVYVRAYMEQAGNDFWSKEVAINITPVVPSGKVTPITIDQTGAPDNDAVSIVLGDAVQINSSFPPGITCDRTSGPEQGPVTSFKADMAIPSPTTSNSIVYTAPDVYQYKCTDPQAHTFQVKVGLN